MPFTSRVKNFDGIEEGDSQESCYIAPTVRITEAAIQRESGRPDASSAS